MQGVLVEQLAGPEWSEALREYSVAVLPMGAASKEHGLHLPNNTDFLEAEALKAVVVERLPVLMLPTFGFGYYPAFDEWPGSLQLSPRTYRTVIGDIVDALAAARLRKLVLLDTGLSTRPVLELVARDTWRRHRMLVAHAVGLGERVEADLFPDDGGTHANDPETSFMLAIAPETVDMSRAVRETRPSTVFSSRAAEAPPAFIQGGRMRSASGVFGDPTLATVEKGQAYFAAKIEDLVAFIEAFVALDLSEGA
jgi:creatinine amidohydrolase